MAGRVEYDQDADFKISDQACDWTVRAISTLRKRLSLNIKMHHKEGQLRDGQIFLFNHFARFETFINAGIENPLKESFLTKGECT